MRLPVVFSCATLALLATAQTSTRRDESEGAIPPASVMPTLFAPGVISSGMAESFPTVTPDGLILYFKRARDRSPETRSYIMTSHHVNDVWSEPEVAEFSGEYSDADPFVSVDGRQLFFTSDRPIGDETPSSRDIWVVERTTDRWSEPIHLGPVVNSDKDEYSPIVTANGTLYFGSNREGGLGSGDLYRSKLIDGQYTEPENLGPQVNSANGEWNLIVSPDETLMIFEASGRAGNISPPGDLYLSRNEGGEWSAASHLGPLNTERSELSPRFSPDLRFLFFASNRSPQPDNLDIYHIEFQPLLAALGIGE